MDISIPYNFEPRAYQLPFFQAMQAGKKRAVLCWHRRSGKDKVSLNWTVQSIALNEAKGVKGIYYYLFPTFAQGRKVLWDGVDRDGLPFLAHFPKPMVYKKMDTEMKLVTRRGSLFQVIGTDTIDSIMGTNPVGVVFSEFSLQNPKAWEYVRPILAENKGWAIFNFTPRGLNHAYKILQQAKEAGWFHQILTVHDTKAISEQTLADERKQMPLDLYEQEYLCRFVEGAATFFKNVDGNVSRSRFAINPKSAYLLGIDLAKYNDFTVIAPLDIAQATIGPLERFNRLEYTYQKAKIKAAAEAYNRARIRLDSTGVGEPIYDDLVHMGLRVEPFRFTEQSRRDLLINLQILLEQKQIKLPNDEQLLSELKSFQYELTERGRVRIAAPDGLHDDCVMAVALAAWGLPEEKRRIESRLRRKLRLRQRPFYDMAEEWWNGEPSMRNRSESAGLTAGIRPF